MVREISAGGVVVRQRDGKWWMAVIEVPEGAESSAAAGKPYARKGKPRLALPKGLVDPGEKPLETAIREVFEETGIKAEAVIKLGDTKYMYTRTWGDGERVFKIVSFYLMRYSSGRIDDIDPSMRIEVARARWVPLADAAELLAYKTEKQMAKRALEYVKINFDSSFAL